MSQLSLEPKNGAGQHGCPLEVIYTYEVRGLPDGHGAWIQNLDYPRSLWSILRFRNGVPEDNPTGNYRSAEDALAFCKGSMNRITSRTCLSGLPPACVFAPPHSPVMLRSEPTGWWIRPHFREQPRGVMRCWLMRSFTSASAARRFSRHAPVRSGGSGWLFRGSDRLRTSDS